MLNEYGLNSKNIAVRLDLIKCKLCSVLGHFADRHFRRQTFRRQDTLPTDISPKVCYGHFTDRHFADTHKIMLNSDKSFLDTDVLMKY